MKLMKHYFLFSALLFSALCCSAMVHAMDINVTKYNDTNDGQCDADCSLREAITLANNTPGVDRIYLNAGTYVVSIRPQIVEEDEIPTDDKNAWGDLDILDDVIIQGSSKEQTILTTNGFGRMIKNISGTSTLTNIVLTGGRIGRTGGAIENHANLTLRYCTVTRNHAAASFDEGAGGGIANYGTLNIYSSEISYNTANAGEGWRGQGGGILNSGNLVIRDSTIRNNYTSDDDDGGSGAGIFNTGTADIRRSLFMQNRLTTFGSGAAILNTGGTLSLYSSTVSDNISGEVFGGAIANGGYHFYPAGQLYLFNVTVTNNSYGGLFSRGATVIRNSIIVNNENLDGLTENCNGARALMDVQSTLIGAEDNPSCYGDIYLTNNKTSTTLLEPLADNGGPTLTHALKPGSILIDAGTYRCPSHDQRGMPTAVDGNDDGIPTCDIGAFEYQPE